MKLALPRTRKHRKGRLKMQLNFPHTPRLILMMAVILIGAACQAPQEPRDGHFEVKDIATDLTGDSGIESGVFLFASDGKNVHRFACPTTAGIGGVYNRKICSRPVGSVDQRLFEQELSKKRPKDILNLEEGIAALLSEIILHKNLLAEIVAAQQKLDSPEAILEELFELQEQLAGVLAIIDELDGQIQLIAGAAAGEPAHRLKPAIEAERTELYASLTTLQGSMAALKQKYLLAKADLHGIEGFKTVSSQWDYYVERVEKVRQAYGESLDAEAAYHQALLFLGSSSGLTYNFTAGFLDREGSHLPAALPYVREVPRIFSLLLEYSEAGFTEKAFAKLYKETAAFCEARDRNENRRQKFEKYMRRLGVNSCDGLMKKLREGKRLKWAQHMASDWQLVTSTPRTCNLYIDGYITCLARYDDFFAFAGEYHPELTQPFRMTISSETGQVCVIDNDEVVCWGSSDPVYNPPQKNWRNPIEIEAGNNHVCVLDDNGVKCWGSNEYGQLRVPPLRNPVQIDAGGHHTCALDDGGVKCWGLVGETGISQIPLLPDPFAIHTSQDGACALSRAALQCWGRHPALASLPKLHHPWQVEFGSRHACALEDYNVTCWGTDDERIKVPAMRNPVMLHAGSDETAAVNHDHDDPFLYWGTL